MDWKNIGKKLLFPPVWVMTFLSVVSAVALVTIFVKGWEETIFAYLCYMLAFYTLSVVCVYCSMVLPKRFRRIKKRVYENPFGNRYMTDTAFRTRISLYLSLGINLLYVGVHLLSWYINRSWWFVVLAGYYVILSVMRFLLVRYIRNNEIGGSVIKEWKRSRTCAGILLLVNLSLSGAVLMILFQHKGYEYHGILIYVMAVFTFYMIIHAVMELVKYRRKGSPVMTTAKIVSLSAALVSILNLETAMFSQFGENMAVTDQQIIISATGGGVSVIVVTLSVILIVRASKEIRSEKNGKQR